MKHRCKLSEERIRIHIMENSRKRKLIMIKDLSFEIKVLQN